MSFRPIISALRKHGPLTNRQLQEIVSDHGGAVARDCQDMIKRGHIVRIDGGKGRGTKAVYALEKSA